MSQSLEQLAFEPELRSSLEAGGIRTLHRLRDSTLASLEACGLTAGQSRLVQRRLDLYLARRFRHALLCPMLPEPCQYVECAYLAIGPELLVTLGLEGFQYLYQLAMSRRHRLQTQLGPAAVTAVAQALAAFVESYRQGEIVLYVEEQIDDG